MSVKARARAAVSVLAIAATFAGCSIVATHEEYASYRAVRDATEDRDRLLAMQQYVERHPGGYWATEIQAQRASHEETVWAASNTTREGLEWYLQVYPDGQYVDQARPRLAALQTVSTRREQEEERQEQLEQEREAQAIEARRTWVTRAVQFWTTTLLGIRNYGSSIQRVVAGNQEFERAFGQAPTPTCQAEFCIKHYGQLYHIPVPGATRIDRHIDVYLRLVLVRGRVERAELLLPNKGFSRWFEMENRTVVTDEDPEQRQAAINWALDRIQPLVQQVAEGATRLDFVPEPINPLQLRGESANTDQAPVAPDEGGPAPAQPPPEGNAPPPAQKQDGDIDDLLNDAMGPEDQNQNQNPQPTPQLEEVQPQPGAELVLPIGLVSWTYRNLRVVVFAAGDEDYEQGYDGIFIERVRN
jgi:hypothetical protein